MICKISYRITKVLDRSKAILDLHNELDISIIDARKMIDASPNLVLYRTRDNVGIYVNGFPGIIEQYNICSLDAAHNIEKEYRNYFSEMGKRCSVEIEPIFEHEPEDYEHPIEYTKEEQEARDWYMKLSATEQKYVDLLTRYHGPTA